MDAIKVCGCGQEYSREAWLALEKWVDRLECEDDDGNEYVCEGRHCVCGSSICVRVDALQAEVAHV